MTKFLTGLRWLALRLSLLLLIFNVLALVGHLLLPADTRGFNVFPSSAEADRHGALVQELTATPDRFPWAGQSIVIKDAWIEQRTRLFTTIMLVPYLVEFPIYMPTAGRSLCFTLEEVPKDDNLIFFVKDSEREFFKIRSLYWNEQTAPEFQQGFAWLCAGRSMKPDAQHAEVILAKKR